MAYRQVTGGDYAPSWRPEPGETIEGVVASFGEHENDWGQYPIVTLRVIENDALTGREEAVHGAVKVLRDFIAGDGAHPGLNVGDRVKIAYKGEARSKKGTRYYLYECLHEPAAEVPAYLRLDSDEAKAAKAAAEAADEEPF